MCKFCIPVLNKNPSNVILHGVLSLDGNHIFHHNFNFEENSNQKLLEKVLGCFVGEYIIDDNSNHVSYSVDVIIDKIKKIFDDYALQK